jgi:hypothetical protein
MSNSSIPNVAKHSSSRTLIHETDNPMSLTEISAVLIQVFEHLNEKTELHIHFVINSIVNNRDLNDCDVFIGTDKAKGVAR